MICKFEIRNSWQRTLDISGPKTRTSNKQSLHLNLKVFLRKQHGNKASCSFYNIHES